MPGEISVEEGFAINARSVLAWVGGLCRMLEGVLRAHDSLKELAASRPMPQAYEPILHTAHDVMTAVFKACERVAKPCRSALECGAYDPRLSMVVNDGRVILSDLVERVSVHIQLPINQWLTELTAVRVQREDWAELWRVSVWAGAMMYHVEDAAITQQALMQFLDMGSILPTNRTGAEWLNEHGALAALDQYRRSTPEARKALKDAVSHVCSQALLALAESSKMRADRALAAAKVVASSRFLDAKDVIHLGIHSQTPRPGGVFLSHRGVDAKRALMDFHRGPRPEIFLDVWARPAGDTNRRFLWRNLGAAREMHAFVTPNYAASEFCMKEVEAWGLISLARGHSADETPGRFFLIDRADTTPSETALCTWTRHCREDATLKSAMQTSAAVLGASGALGARYLHSEEVNKASDEFNRVLLASGMMDGRADLVIGLSRETIKALSGLFRKGATLISHGAVVSLLPEALPPDGAAFVAELRQIAGSLLHAVKSQPMYEPPMRGIVLALAAIAEMSAHTVRHWDGGSPNAIGRSTIAFAKFGQVIDSVAEQFANWFTALAAACFEEEGDEVLFAGLLLGLLPIDHESAQATVRVGPNFCVPAAPTLPLAFEEAGLARRNVQVVCTSAPTVWQRVAVIAALSSFTSRSFLFVDVEGSGALDAHVGAIPMEDFPHVSVARIEDLPEL